jgi:cadmium resistance protein CadD (predicted permease)
VTLVLQAVGLFAVTNVDDIVVLALFFARGAGHRRTTQNVALGQYLGFTGILVVVLAAGFGVSFLPERFVPLLGVLPLALGVKAAVQAWRHRHDAGEAADARVAGRAPGVLELAAVTSANGGDNIGVYVPVFATASPGGVATYVVVFLVLLGVWVAAGRFFATRPLVAAGLSRWGHVLLPVVLVGIGVLLLVEGF